MSKTFSFFILTFGVCCLTVSGQQYSAGQVCPSNAVTYMPATNGTQIPTATVIIPAHTFTIQNQNFGSTNGLAITANVIYGGTVTLVPLSFTVNGGSTVYTTYVPSVTNGIDTIKTLQTNLNTGGINIGFQVATTNDASTNLQVTISQQN